MSETNLGGTSVPGPEMPTENVDMTGVSGNALRLRQQLLQHAAQQEQAAPIDLGDDDDQQEVDGNGDEDDPEDSVQDQPVPKEDVEMTSGALGDSCGDQKPGASRRQQDENENDDDDQKEIEDDENDQVDDPDDQEDHDDEDNNNDQDDDQEDDEDSDNKDDGSDSDGDDQDDDDDDESDNDGSDGGDNQDEGDDENGLSAYERMRLERIKRNQEYLATLGLEGNSNAIPKKKKRIRKSVPTVPARPRSSLSRRTKQKVSYVPQPLRVPNGTVPNHPSNNKPNTAATAAAKPQKDSSKKPRKASQRMDRGIYDEFKRITSKRKQLLRQAKRDVRTAEKELKHWARQSRNFQRKHTQRKEVEGMIQANKEQREALGCTSLELLQDIDRRNSDLISVVINFEESIKNQERQAQKQAQTLELERKMKTIDALERFPKAIKEAFGTLNSMLLERTPRDPPPPRRSKRKSDVDDESATHSPVDKKQKGDEHESLDKGQRWRELAKSFGPEASAAASSTSPAPSTTPQHNATVDDASKSSSAAKPKKKRELTGRNVGGWISPKFSHEVDRSWLEKEKPTTTFDLSKYVPQVGDTVLYYPSAHQTFLESNPDTLGTKMRNVLRVPLWQRAKRERAKLEKAPGTQKTWWTDEWLEGIASDLGDYPIICRVERAHAEFPPDPYSALKQIEKEGGEVKVSWTLPAAGGGKKCKNKTHMRLAAVLRPLTTVVPPAWTDDGPVEDDSLDLPPNFTVITAPFWPEPFLVPFAWGYCLTHSISSGDQVAPIVNADKKGKICDFNSIGEKYGSFRLEDKMQIIRHVLGQLKDGSQGSLEAVEETVSARLRFQSNLEFSDACAVVEFLSGFMEGRASTSTSTEDSPSRQVNLLTLVRCTLPILNGICVNDVYNRKKHYYSPWRLSVGKHKKSEKHEKVPMIAGIQEGLPHAFDDAMRFKIECTIDDFIKNNPGAEIFIPPVTDDIAPSYSCAVPISMCLQKVLSRLKVGKASSRCYYTSIESVLFDLQAIADNCVLYNSPDSDVVEAALDLIPTAKKMISDVSNRHIKEHNARMKEEEERKRLVLRQVDASSLEQPTPNEDNKSASTKKSKISIVPGNLNAPCKAPLHKDWLQHIGPDGSWSVAPAETLDVSQWVPQSGDSIIYSRSLHTKFVKGHYSSMVEDQCIIPRFQLSEDRESPSEVATIAGNAKRQDSGIDLNLLETIDTQWMKGTIAWVRACFPRNPGKDVEETFDQNSPLLAIAMRFDYDWIKGGLFVVYWRPCIFCEDADAGPSFCGTCGVSTETSFLRPAWAHINTEEVISSQPLQQETVSNTSLGLPDIFRTSIGRCFDMLKRRCLCEIPADYVDPNFSRENVKSGSTVALAKMGSRSLPSFQVSLEPKSNASSKKTIATRGIRKTETEEPGTELLSDVHYLPPWFPAPPHKSGTKKSAVLPLYEIMMPTPKISLELILLRVRSGYYRQIAALNNDIIEAYVSSVLFVLYEPALRKTNPLSMRKIARFMASSKGNSGAVSYSKTSKKKVSKADESTNGDAGEKSTEKQVSKSTSSLFSLNEEESQLVARIDKVRRLYATALVCVSETSHVERIFGISSPTEKRSHVEETLHVDEDQISAVTKMKYLLAAVGRDPSRNTFGGIHGLKKLKITCEGQVVPGEMLVRQKVANPAALPGTSLPSPPTPVQVTAILIPWKICEQNDKLARVLYGRFARMFPCVRCQVYCRSIHSCRVQKGHSNPDFDLIHNFSGVGGVDGLLRPFLSQKRKEASLPMEEAPSELVETNGEASAPSTANVQNDDIASSKPAASDTPKTDEIALKKSDFQAGQGASDLIDDPTKFLQTSQTALKMANRLLNQAEMLAKAPTRLDEEFITSYFPVDPTDGHYIYCIVCGLSGDVICCEGCQNVVHTHCIGLPQIPEDDWFCSKCVAKQRCSESKKPPSELPPVIGNADGNAAAQETEAQMVEISGDAIETVTDTTENKPPATQVVSCAAQKEGNAPDPETAANPPVQFVIEAVPETSALPAISVAPLPENFDSKADSKVAGEVQKNDKMTKSDTEPPVTSTMSAQEHLKSHSRLPAPISDCQFDKEAAELAQYLEELQAERTKNDPPPVIPEATKKALAEQNSASVSGGKAESKREGSDPADQSEEPSRRIPIGTKFAKGFDEAGEFQGEVVSLPTVAHLFYGVRYEDGDEEDLNESELLDLLPLSESKKYAKTPVKKKQRYWSRVKKTPSKAPAESEAPSKKKQRYWSRRKSETPVNKKQRYWSRVKKEPSEAPSEVPLEVPAESETPTKKKQRYWSRRKKTPTSAQPEPESSSDADSNNPDDNAQLPGRRSRRPPNRFRPPSRFSDQALKLYTPQKIARSTPDRMEKSSAVDSVTRRKGGRGRSDEVSSHEQKVPENSTQKRASKRSHNSPSKAEQEAEGQPQKRTRFSPRKLAPDEEDEAPAPTATVLRGRGRPRKSLVEDVEVVDLHKVASRKESSSRASRRGGRSIIADQEEEKQESVIDVLNEVRKLDEEEDAPEDLRRGRTRRQKRHFDDM